MKRLFIASFFLGISLLIHSQNSDYNQFLKETQISSSEADELSLVWWIPVEFWEITFQKDQSMTEEEIKEFIDVLKPYTMFAVVYGSIGNFGGIDYFPVDEIRETLVLTDMDSQTHHPLDFDALDPDIQNLILMFNPVLKNMMGELGNNMNFFVFEDIKNKKQRIADPLAEGRIQLSFADKDYSWRTPLGSLLPTKYCPKDNEPMNGAWKYCPWHGDKLIEKIKE